VNTQKTNNYVRFSIKAIKAHANCKRFLVTDRKGMKWLRAKMKNLTKAQRIAKTFSESDWNEFRGQLQEICVKKNIKTK
jgi:hypothetical protein